ncbi:MAG: purine-nucleoside phosphorylase [Pseudobdellovibrionaceae bacterium]
MAESSLHNRLHETVSFLKAKTGLKPQVGIVLGSGLGAFARDIQVEATVPFHEIPNFVSPSVEGHQGNLIFGKIGDKQIVALQGRLHYYEGHSLDMVVFPTRVMALLGIPVMILTNSAGGLGEQMKSGDFMIIEDHINLTGANPLMGPNMKELGPRFPDMTEAYDRKLIAQLEAVFQKKKIRYHKGIYAGVSGPTYETPAEVRFLKTIGCSAVGMSTVPESIAANHLGLRVAALSCITNLAAGLSATKLTHEEVTETAKRVEKDFASVLKDFIAGLPA